MSSDFPTPGLKRRTRKGGPDVPVWVARADLVMQGYEPKTVRLPYRLDEPDDAALLSATCLRLQAEMLEWLSGKKRDPNRFDGTLVSLSRRYQTDEASPFNTNMKHNTRRTALSTVRLIEKAFGQRVLAHLKNEDFRRWYNEAKKPKDPGGPERIHRAYGIIKKLRELFAYGIMDELPDCQRLHTVLSQARYSQPARRRIAMQLAHVEAFATKAQEMGRRNRRVDADSGRRESGRHRHQRPPLAERLDLIRPRRGLGDSQGHDEDGGVRRPRPQALSDRAGIAETRSG